MQYNHNSLGGKILDGIFGLLHKVWFWVILLIVLGKYYGYITQDNFAHIFNSVVDLLKEFARMF
jgi:hypothetical protein